MVSPSSPKLPDVLAEMMTASLAPNCMGVKTLLPRVVLSSAPDAMVTVPPVRELGVPVSLLLVLPRRSALTCLPAGATVWAPVIRTLSSGLATTMLFEYSADRSSGRSPAVPAVTNEARPEPLLPVPALPK